MPPVGAQPPPAQPTYYPGVEEEYEVSHSAFHRAFEDAKPAKMRVPGLQEFAAAIWERRRAIPSQHDPLLHIFDEFDTNGDGVLTASEIAAAMRSRGVTVSTEQVQGLIEAFEEKKAHMIVRQEWPDFVYSLTVADLHAKDQYVPGKTLESLDS
eukprot:CAMPEP_0202901934 /NCGR_PEP_ID=MMETSP1392-20130828/15408_1 /ASSEMBLY_ACC=CAM_ASM_000868 /TAXON_ID=225041 /ORGANISM="Chlamydomonas chlamydogama, Strain SAG 11-48b" /LENGTH=153 /DNA_ID=CAMNT_0049588597 /DNA_START=249 /DNA_END=710 /DNA_ORIENTATION=-